MNILISPLPIQVGDTIVLIESLSSEVPFTAYVSEILENEIKVHETPTSEAFQIFPIETLSRIVPDMKSLREFGTEFKRLTFHYTKNGYTSINAEIGFDDKLSIGAYHTSISWIKGESYMSIIDTVQNLMVEKFPKEKDIILGDTNDKNEEKIEQLGDVAPAPSVDDLPF